MRHPTTDYCPTQFLTFRHEYPWIWLKSTAETCLERTILDPESNVWNISRFWLWPQPKGLCASSKRVLGAVAGVPGAVCATWSLSLMIDTPGEQTGMCEFSIVFPSYSMPHFSFRAHSRNMHLLHGYLNRAGPPTSIVSPTSLRHRWKGGQVVCTAGNGADSMKLGHRDGRWWKQCEDVWKIWRELLSRHGSWVPVGWHGSQFSWGSISWRARLMSTPSQEPVNLMNPWVFHDRKVYEHTKNDLGVEESVDGKWW